MEIRGRKPHFGVQLQAQAATWAEYVAAVQGVEELGYGSVWNFDHMLPFAGADDRACFETLTTLSAMALLTEHIRVGTLVNGVLYRDPVTLAKAAAQVDQMSGGRLEFSLGATWAVREFNTYGLEFPPLAERYQRLDEALEVVTLLWSQERSDFEGRYYRLASAPCNPKPLQVPHPPITVGGTGLGSLRVAARHADRLNMIGPPEQCARCNKKLEELCTEAGRDFSEIELSSHPTISVARTRELAEAQAEELASRNSIDLAAEPGRWVVGSPSEVRERLQRYFEVGVSHFVFAVGYPFDLAHLRLLQEEVLAAIA
jgi:alkanesulfonate monooxygenase SsuD/methylene tetrahydromethanopterin reductase-like flavin-dependent oxidoreductase (luciferase family)